VASPVYFLYPLIFLVAIVYSSAGFGGASGYLLVMSFFELPIEVMASTALVLNIVVASISFSSYLRAGYFRLSLLFPFLTSIPAAFLGGLLKISEQTYFTLLYLVLTYLGLRMIAFPTLSERPNWTPRPIPLWLSLLVGTIIGLLSGMLGIGGGIFLSPLIVLMQWGTVKQAAASAGAFIALNSLSGLLGRVASDTFSLGEFGLPLLAVGIAGALIGSHMGAMRFSQAGVRRALGLILLIAVGVYWYNFLL